MGFGTECADDDGNICGDPPANCELCSEPDCVFDSDCGDGFHCVGGNCVPSFEEESGCNSPGSENCQRVVHVKRPYFPDGTPNTQFWGLAINFPDCKTGEIDEDDLGGVVSMDLVLDIEDDEGDPAGVYASGCCCPLYLNILRCGADNVAIPCCVDLSGVCTQDEIPVWDPETEILIVRNKPGTPAFCGHSVQPPSADSCGQTGGIWSISPNCAFGDCGEAGCIKSPCCDCKGGCGVNFVDLEFEVIAYDPTWDPARFCLYACPGCWAVVSPCGNCDSNYYPGSGHCLTPFACDGSDNAKTYHARPYSACNSSVDVWGEKECFFRDTIISNQDVASWDFYYTMTLCEGGAGGTVLIEPVSSLVCEGEPVVLPMAPCDNCRYSRYQLCSCSDSNCPPSVYSQFRVDGNEPFKKFVRDSEEPPAFTSAGCFSLVDENSLFTKDIQPTWEHQSALCPEDSVYTNCTIWNAPYQCFYDCQECLNPDIHLCCAEGVSGFDESDGFHHLSLFPEKIETTIRIEIDQIQQNVDVSFSDPKPLVPPKENTSNIESMSFYERRPWLYTVDNHHATKPINDRATTGAYASPEVPKVKDAIYLGAYMEGEVEWSAWLAISPIHAQTIEKFKARYFTFSYSVFAYCNSKCDKMSKLLQPERGVSFKAEAII